MVLVYWGWVLPKCDTLAECTLWEDWTCYFFTDMLISLCSLCRDGVWLRKDCGFAQLLIVKSLFKFSVINQDHNILLTITLCFDCRNRTMKTLIMFLNYYERIIWENKWNTLFATLLQIRSEWTSSHYVDKQDKESTAMLVVLWGALS